MKKTIYLIFILAMTACSEKDLDQPMAPNLILGEATDITSTTANLHGTVTLHGEKKSQCIFLLSTSSAFDTNVIKQKATKNEGMIDQQVSSLSPQTTYYYKMAVTSGYSTVDSESKKFTTAIETSSGTGGTSDYTDGGSLNGNDGESGGGNTGGSGRGSDSSGSISSSTNFDCIATLVKAGTLQSLIPEANKYKIKSLKIIGPINGSDVVFFRDMAGIANNKTTDTYTTGGLEILDLSEVLIQDGGEAIKYQGEERYTEMNYFFSLFIQGTTTLKKFVFPKIMTRISFSGYDNTHLEYFEAPQGEIPYTSSNGIVFENFGKWLAIYPPYMAKDSYEIPAEVTSIQINAFKGVRKLKEIIIPNTLKSIRSAAFQNFQCMDGSSYAITIPSSVTSLDMNLFTFSTFKTINIYAQVSTLEQYLFRGCENLEKVILSSSIQTINEHAFEDCPNLKEIHLLSTKPPTVNNTLNSQFSNANKANCVLYVPKGSLSAYKAATIWGDFTHIVEE